jgi:hypothetical protein
MFSIKLNGVKKLEKRYSGSALNKIIKDEIELAAFGTQGDAISKCVSSSVAASSNLKITDKSFELSFADQISPFIEFGTGSKVFESSNFNFTPEMKSYARNFFVNGLGRTPAFPFLFPSAIDNYKQMVKNIKKEVAKL